MHLATGSAHTQCFITLIWVEGQSPKKQLIEVSMFCNAQVQRTHTLCIDQKLPNIFYSHCSRKLTLFS